MTTYRYTSPYPAIFMDLTVGSKGLSIVRVHAEDEQPDGATVFLNPGDIITLPNDFEHAHLEPAEKPTKTKTPATKPASDAPASDEKGN